MDLIVIHHPDAGAGDWSTEAVERLLRGAGHTARIASTHGKWRRLLDEQPDAFVVVGGDGTVHRLLRALEGQPVPVAILPTGTANNVAHALGYQAGDALAARIARWRENERTVQLARVARRGRQRTFVETVGVGVFADLMHRSSGDRKHSSPNEMLEGFRRQLAADLLEAEPMQVTAAIDGQQLAGEFLLVECLNLPYYGPRLRLAPAESPEAPTVTVCGVSVDARAAAARWIRTSAGDPSDFVLGRGSVVRLSAPTPAHVDGRPWPKTKRRAGVLRIRAAAATVRVWV